VDWLRRSVGLKIWYDGVSGDASKRTTTLLANAIQSARGSLFFLSSNWRASSWCGDEHEIALTERRTNDTYSLVAAQINDLDIPPWFKIANVLDFRRFDARSAADFLRSMVPNPPVRFDNTQDVYFAGPWSRPSNAAKSTLQSLHEMGLAAYG
jgi:TIR domain